MGLPLAFGQGRWPRFLLELFFLKNKFSHELEFSNTPPQLMLNTNISWTLKSFKLLTLAWPTTVAWSIFVEWINEIRTPWGLNPAFYSLEVHRGSVLAKGKLFPPSVVCVARWFTCSVNCVPIQTFLPSTKTCDEPPSGHGYPLPVLCWALLKKSLQNCLIFKLCKICIYLHPTPLEKSR